jgi:hypothetical protein
VVGWEAVGGLFGEIEKTEGTKILFARLGSSQKFPLELFGKFFKSRSSHQKKRRSFFHAPCVFLSSPLLQRPSGAARSDCNRRVHTGAAHGGDD